MRRNLWVLELTRRVLCSTVNEGIILAYATLASRIAKFQRRDSSAARLRLFTKQPRHLKSMFALLFDRKSGTVTALALGGVALLIFTAGLLVGSQVNWDRIATRLRAAATTPEVPMTSEPATSEPAGGAEETPAPGEWVPFPKPPAPAAPKPNGGP
jgi:hypothetical protein